MPLGMSPSDGGELSPTMDRLTELWRTVGHNEVDGQVVKQPNGAEADQLRDLLGRALSALNGA